MRQHFQSEHFRSSSSDKPLVEYVFSESNVFTEYKRTKYNLIDILSELGGLFNSFYLLGFAFTISFSYNLFLSSIIRAIYHFNARFPEELKKSKKTAARSNQVAAVSQSDFYSGGADGGSGVDESMGNSRAFDDSRMRS